MKIKSEADYQQLNGLLQHIQSLPPNQNPIWLALDRLANVHFARFAFLENNTRLAVITTYDGTFDNYINESLSMPSETSSMPCSLAHMSEAPSLPVQKNRAEFLAYVKANDFRGIEPFYSAYPKATVLDIKAGLSQD